jgi:putative spermidine/putrescine transport system ATP-binding protein
MTTKPRDTSSPDRQGSGANETLDLEADTGPDAPGLAENNRPDTVLPHTQPEIVKVKPPPGRGANPFLKHFVEDGPQGDPSVRPQAADRAAPEHIGESLDDLDDQVIADSLERGGPNAEAARETQAPEEHHPEAPPEPEQAFQEVAPEDHPAEQQAFDEPPPQHEPETLQPRAEQQFQQAEQEPPVIVSAVPEIGPDPLPAIPFVAFKGVQKTFDGKTAVVSGLNLNVAKGEFLTLLGPSGSGKTTTLMMLAGFEEPTQGYIELDGMPISHLPPHKRNIGMVFQNYALFPHMTVAENVAFPLRVRGTPGREVRDRVAQALKMVSLDGFEKRRPFQLSGGQQQRVAVARALVFNPSLVLMDEPLGALDRHLREQMQFEIKKLHRDLGLTVVYVTHDQSEALTLSDRIAVFHEGHIQQVDTPEALYETPANAFVASFVGENNKLPGAVQGADDHYAVVALDGGQKIRSVRKDCGGAGSRAVVMVRPEHMRIATEASAKSGENLIEAHVEDVVFHGDHMRTKLIVPGCGELTVKTPGRVPGLRGDTAFVAFRIQDAPAFRPME